MVVVAAVLSVQFCGCLLLIHIMLFPNKGLRPFLVPPELSAGFLRWVAPAFDLDAKLSEVFLKVRHPDLLLSS